MTHDLVVIGGGPVGLATALYAVQHGLTPVVLEPRVGPIDKACGEGLMPGGLQALHSLGIDPEGHPLRGIRYVSPGRSVAADFRLGPGRGIRRTTLHDVLRRAVEAAGVTVLPLAATHVAQGSVAVAITTKAETLQARWVVAADGLHSPTRRALGLDRRARALGRVRPSRMERARFGLRRHYGIRPWSDHVEVHWAPDAEAYVTPVADDLVGVAVLSDKRSSLDETLAAFPDLRDRLAGAPPMTSVRGAGPLRQRSTRRVSGRVLLAGDASGYVDALTGEGISLGLAHARAAVTALAAGDPSSYERSWRAANRRYALLTHALVAVSRPRWGRRLLVPAASALPSLFAATVNELAKPGRA